MTLFFTITLGISVVGLLGLLGVKRWEMTTGRVMLSHIRPRLGDLLHRTLAWAEHVAPALVAHYASVAYRAARTWLHRLTAWSVLMLERVLEQTLRFLRHKTDAPTSGGEASIFLREVAEHKKKLQESADSPGQIFEE